ncbi:MAG: ClbS/DfsB family four-helix bundle protein [Bacteroides sp.]|nr:ClbS/DfsB family four-helix bundle protein [Bacteroides sp.]
MARPTTKEQLKQSSEENFHKLFTLIHSMTQEEQEKLFSFENRDKNIRDVLVHLYEWHQLLLKWVHSNRSGNRTDFLPKPYNWKTYPQMNIVFWEKHQNTPLKEAVILLQKSHSDVMTLMDLFSEEELFTKKYFSWTGTSSLGAYCISATSSHYDWAMKKIRKHKKELTGK